MKTGATQTADARPSFRRERIVLPVPTPALKFQKAQPGVPDTQLTREATRLLHEFSTPLLFNHSHRVFFWANELGRQTGQPFDVELLFVCAAFHDLGLLRKFSSVDDRFEVDGAIAKAFPGGFERKTQTTEGTCNEDICSQFIRNYERINFYDQIQS
jgi:hypothetical protein